MEAIGKYDFDASAEDELSFRKGDVLKILSTEENWYKAEIHGHEGFVPKNYVETQVHRWFQEHTSRTSAEEQLMPCLLGSFLIRGSQSSPGDFSISVRHEFDVQHFKVMKDNKGHYFLWAEKFTSLNKLIEFYKTTSISKQRQIFLKEGRRTDPGPPMHQQVKRGSLPEMRANPHRGFAGQPHSVSPCRNFDPDPVPQFVNHRGTGDRRAHTIGATGRASSAGPTLVACRGSDTLPPTQRPARQVRALYDFTAEEQDELGFSAGDVLEVLDCSDTSWWKGRLRGRIGLFPSNYTMPM